MKKIASHRLSKRALVQIRGFSLLIAILLSSLFLPGCRSQHIKATVDATIKFQETETIETSPQNDIFVRQTYQIFLPPNWQELIPAKVLKIEDTLPKGMIPRFPPDNIIHVISQGIICHAFVTSTEEEELKKLLFTLDLTHPGNAPTSEDSDDKTKTRKNRDIMIELHYDLQGTMETTRLCNLAHSSNKSTLLFGGKNKVRIEMKVEVPEDIRNGWFAFMLPDRMPGITCKVLDYKGGLERHNVQGATIIGREMHKNRGEASLELELIPARLEPIFIDAIVNMGGTCKQLFLPAAELIGPEHNQIIQIQGSNFVYRAGMAWDVKMF